MSKGRISNLKEYVWLIRSGSEYGGGLCIHPHGLLITASSVVGPGGVCEARRYIDGFRNATVWHQRYYPNFGVALVWVEKTPTELFPAWNLVSIDVPFDIDQDVFAFIHQGKFTFSFATAKIAYPFPPNCPHVDMADDRTMAQWFGADYENLESAFCQTFPFRKLGHVTELGDNLLEFHPHLPLIQTHGFNTFSGSFGCPVFRLSDHILVGLIVFHKSGYDFVVPPSIMSTFQSLGTIERPILSFKNDKGKGKDGGRGSGPTTSKGDRTQKKKRRSGEGGGSGSRGYVSSGHGRRRGDMVAIEDNNLESAILKASPCVVGVVCGIVPPELTDLNEGYYMIGLSYGQVYRGSGFVIECNDIGGNEFDCVVLTAANLFTGISEPQVEIHIDNGDIYVAEVLVVDHHYNIAAVHFTCETSLHTVEMRGLDCFLPFHPEDTSQGAPVLRPHSLPFRVVPGDTLIALGRRPLEPLSVNYGPFSSAHFGLDCKEVYCIGIDHKGDRGGPAINYNGEVIGLMVHNDFFLPSNVLSRWWNFFKLHHKLCRPWIGVEVANLHDASFYLLEALLLRFPSVSSGVVVTKVLDNSPAYQSGLRSEDVIVECDGALVRSTLEFFDRIWDKAGLSVVLKVARMSSGECFNLTVAVDEATFDNFYRWPIPEWSPRPRTMDSSEEETCSGGTVRLSR